MDAPSDRQNLCCCSKTFFFSQRFDKTVQPVDFSLRGEEMGRSLETEIKVAKLLQKQPWVPLDDFFYRT